MPARRRRRAPAAEDGRLARRKSATSSLPAAAPTAPAGVDALSWVARPASAGACAPASWRPRGATVSPGAHRGPRPRGMCTCLAPPVAPRAPPRAFVVGPLRCVAPRPRPPFEITARPPRRCTLERRCGRLPSEDGRRARWAPPRGAPSPRPPGESPRRAGPLRGVHPSRGPTGGGPVCTPIVAAARGHGLTLARVPRSTVSTHRSRRPFNPWGAPRRASPVEPLRCVAPCPRQRCTPAPGPPRSSNRSRPPARSTRSGGLPGPAAPEASRRRPGPPPSTRFGVGRRRGVLRGGLLHSSASFRARK